MPLITILVVLIVVGLILWLVNTYLPLPPPWKTVINAVAVIFTVLWLLQATGLLAPLYRIRVG